MPVFLPEVPLFATPVSGPVGADARNDASVRVPLSLLVARDAYLRELAATMAASEWKKRALAATGSPREVVAIVSRPWTQDDRRTHIAILRTAVGVVTSQWASGDAEVWAAVGGVNASTDSIRDVAWHAPANMWIAIGDQWTHTLGTGIAAVWTPIGSSGMNFYAMTSSPTQCVMVGAGGLIVTTPDGVSYTVRSAVGSGGALYDVCFGNGRFVAIGDGFIRHSTDGFTWTLVSHANLGAASCCVYDASIDRILVFAFDGAGFVARITPSTGAIEYVSFPHYVECAAYSPVCGVVFSGGPSTLGVGSNHRLRRTSDGGTTIKTIGPAFTGPNGEHELKVLEYSEALGSIFAGGVDTSAAAPLLSQSMRVA